MAVVCEPCGVGPCASADIVDPERAGRTVSPHDLLSADELELARAPAQPLGFDDLHVVVVANLRGWLDHDATVRSDDAPAAAVLSDAAGERGRCGS
jgi:hypothetical protein